MQTMQRSDRHVLYLRRGLQQGNLQEVLGKAMRGVQGMSEEKRKVLSLDLDNLEKMLGYPATDISFIVFDGKNGRRVRFVQDNKKVIDDVRQARRIAKEGGGTLPEEMDW